MWSLIFHKPGRNGQSHSVRSLRAVNFQGSAGIKDVLANNDEIETLIFDEIDTGISGRTAQKVSEKMDLIGRNHQVICITHLPQIAAMADTHFLIEKTVESGRTTSKIHRLPQEESVAELARMLGGVSITETVLENAKEMKELAAKTKKS